MRGSIGRRARVAAGFLGVAGALVQADAYASGLEIPEGGALGLARGGAVIARPTDALALMYNPAGMVALPGAQFTLGSNFGSFSQCVQRYGNYANEDQTAIFLDGTRFAGSRYAASGTTTPYPRMCNNPSLALAPNLAFTYRILPNLAVGIGAYPPHSVGREGVYPDSVMTSNGLAPSPLRHLLYEKRLLLFYPSLSIAVAPLPWLRIGGSFQVGLASFEYATHLNPNDGSGAAQSPDGDLKLTLRASGTFVTGNVGVQVILPRFFTIGVKAQYIPQLNLTGPGGGTAIDQYYSSNASTLAQRTTTFDVGSLIAQPPSHVRAGVRFAMPRAGRPNAWESAHRLAANNTVANGRNFEDSYDPMRDDAWDLEVDFNYEFTSSLGQTSVDPRGMINAAGIVVPFRNDMPGMPGTGTRINIRSDFANTFGVRVGGDWNVIPDRLALRMGFSGETGASVPTLSQLHLPTYDTFSAHLGAGLRFGWFTANVAYAHIFFVPLEDPTGNRSIITTRAINPDPMIANNPCPAQSGRNGACNINAARYEASMDLVAINLSGRW
jgi:hypothetical protein